MKLVQKLSGSNLLGSSWKYTVGQCAGVIAPKRCEACTVLEKQPELGALIFNFSAHFLNLRQYKISKGTIGAVGSFL